MRMTSQCKSLPASTSIKTCHSTPSPTRSILFTATVKGQHHYTQETFSRCFLNEQKKKKKKKNVRIYL